MKNGKNIAVIGAGLGGMSAAVRLAFSGFNVEVYEQNDFAGGKAGEVKSDGFRFDAGPTLLTMPSVLEDLFASAGKKLGDYIELHRLPVICKYFYPDGTVINAYSDVEKFAAELENNTADTRETLSRYLKYSERIYDLTADLFLFGSFGKLSSFLKMKSLNTLFNITGIDPFRTVHGANSAFFSDKKTIQLFDRYATYNGSNPFKAPATLNIIPHVEYNLGGYVPRGGINAVSRGVYKLAIESGVKFNFGTKADKIIAAGNRVKGLEFSKGKIHNTKNYDAVVSNADVNFTYGILLDDKTSPAARKYLRQEPSVSALVFYWGVKAKSDNLEIHNILFSENYKKEFEDIFSRKICPEDPTVYIYISSKYNPEDAPDGYENWYVMINAPYNENQNWDEEISRMRSKLILKIKNLLGVDLTDKIISEKMLTPPEIEKRTGSHKGALYGISSNSKSAAFLRQQNESKKYKGLYFCGGSAHPGGGIPLVILSGKTAAELILNGMTGAGK